ncbi:MAG: hypothetical protein FWB90_05950 [Fibromonadales bacterium]|nr:hypothetical protein [Fibromonadales bacterium]
MSSLLATLASNFIFAVMPSTQSGEFLAVSKHAIDKIQVNEQQFGEIQSYPFPKEYSLVNDLVPAAIWYYENGKLYMPYYEIENGYHTKNAGTAEFANGKFNLKLDTLEHKIPDTIMVNGIKATINSTAKIGNETFYAALGIESHYGFLLKNNVAQNRSEFVIAVTDFPINSSVQGLAVATYGNGILFSADTGKTWKNLMNRSPVGNNLKTIRAVPSVLRGQSATSLIAYKVSENSKITIEVFSYDMKKIRTIVKNALRLADPVRSSNPSEDIWDGRDDSGRHAAMGTYYIKVSDNHGNTGWTKAMSLGGN